MLNSNSLESFYLLKSFNFYIEKVLWSFLELFGLSLSLKNNIPNLFSLFKTADGGPKEPSPPYWIIGVVVAIVIIIVVTVIVLYRFGKIGKRSGE